MVSNETLTELSAACRKKGLKLTHQRLEIFEELNRSSDHPSAETLYWRLKERYPSISLDTVYRTLCTFREHGLIRKVETVESQARFEACLVPHHHLICRECQAISDFLWPEIDNIPNSGEMTNWGKIESRSVVVYGICKKCQDNSKNTI
jgi:Fur family peroxide stress response transcriptional regulator